MVLRNGVERWQTPEPQSPSADRAVPTDLGEEYLQAVRRLDQRVERDRLAMLAAHAYGTAFPTSRDRGTLADMDEPRSGSGPEGHDPDLLHEADLLREVEQRTLIGQAAAVLLEGYGLTPVQAATFLAEKAAEDDRDVADVALEIVRDQPTRLSRELLSPLVRVARHGTFSRASRGPSFERLGRRPTDPTHPATRAPCPRVDPCELWTQLMVDGRGTGTGPRARSLEWCLGPPTPRSARAVAPPRSPFELCAAGDREPS